MRFTLHRPAIAMIELIFAIVVMGIVIMSAPQMLATAAQSGYTAIQQEGINEAASQMNMILDYPWDENNTEDNHTSILYVSNNGDNELNATSSTPPRRAGTPDESTRLYISNGAATYNASNIGSDINEGNLTTDIDDIDDFNGTLVNLALSGSASTIDYIEKGADINIARTVTYMDDNATNYTNGGVNGVLSFIPTFTTNLGTTNIKRLQVTLTSAVGGVSELSKTITLHAFSCNIGTYKLKEK